tara:strand:- start:277 stop:1248 length:972 start_codon:yes stop_codon:yes gene_type:complete
MKSFTFAVLVYNHEKWILEHLESIKYLINRYKPSIVDIIINDDSSNDNSINIINSWLEKNSDLFRQTIKIYNQKNIGTVSSTKNIINQCKTENLKITAGDDVYSFENIFYFSENFLDSQIISGIPYYLEQGELFNSNYSNALHLASSIIYKNNKRFSYLHATNAPNIIYSLNKLKEAIHHPLFKKIKLVEDLLIQVLISEEDFKFMQINKIFVYYRRTVGSTYLIKESQFCKDQQAIMKYQISKSGIIESLIIKNKYFCFGIRNKIFKYLFNLPFYIFIIKTFLNSFKVIKDLVSFNVDNSLKLHKKHYYQIKEISKSHINEI